jgi:hypothetical protein
MEKIVKRFNDSTDSNALLEHKKGLYSKAAKATKISE